MADKVVGIVVNISGKNELSKSLTEINKDLSKTNSALKDVDKALKLDPTNLELVEQKQELLSKAIAGTEEKLKLMRQAAEDAKKGLEDGTVTREQYAQLTAEIVKTEHGLKELQDQANGTGEAMDEVIPDNAQEQTQQFTEQTKNAGVSMDDLKTAALAAGPAIGAVIAVAGAGVSVLIDMANAAIETAKAIGEFLADSAREATEELDELIRTLGEYTIAGAGYSDEILTLSQTSGISAKTLQQLSYSAELVDVSLDTIVGTLKKVTKGLGDAGDKERDYILLKDELDRKLEKGTISLDDYNAQLEKAGSAYTQLGVSVLNQDGTLRDSYDVFLDTVDALSKIENQTERDTTAMSILGRSASDLEPLFRIGSEGLRQFGEEAEQMGYVLSDSQLEAYGEFDDNIQRLTKGIEAAKNGLGLILLPLLTSLSDDGAKILGKFNRGLVEANGDITKIGQVLNQSIPEVINLVVDHLPEAAELVSQLVETLLNSIAENSPAILEAVFTVVNTIADTLLSPENIQHFFDSINIILQNIQTFIQTHGADLISIGVSILTSIINGITSTIPVLIPALTEAITTIIHELTKPETVSAVLGAVTQLITAAALGIADAIPALEAEIPGLVNALCTAITVLSPLILDAGTMLLQSLIDSGVIDQVMTTLGPFIFDMVKMIGERIYWNAPIIAGEFIKMFGEIALDAFNWGADIVQELTDGMLSKVGTTLVGGLATTAAKINSYLHFSTPDEGPLAYWQYDNPGAGMVDYIAEGMQQELPDLESSLNLMAGTIATGATPDYTGQLNGINGTLSSIAGAEREIIIPVYIGQDRIETMVVKAATANNYISGGR